MQLLAILDRSWLNKKSILGLRYLFKYFFSEGFSFCFFCFNKLSPAKASPKTPVTKIKSFSLPLFLLMKSFFSISPQTPTETEISFPKVKSPPIIGTLYLSENSLMPFEKSSIHFFFLVLTVKAIESHFNFPPHAAISLAATAHVL